MAEQPKELTLHTFILQRYRWIMDEYAAALLAHTLAQEHTKEPIRETRYIRNWKAQMPSPYHTTPIAKELQQQYRTPSTHELLEMAIQHGDTTRMAYLETKLVHERLARVPPCDNPTLAEANLSK